MNVQKKLLRIVLLAILAQPHARAEDTASVTDYVYPGIQAIGGVTTGSVGYGLMSDSMVRSINFKSQNPLSIADSQKLIGRTMLVNIVDERGMITRQTIKLKTLNDVLAFDAERLNLMNQSGLKFSMATKIAKGKLAGGIVLLFTSLALVGTATAEVQQTTDLLMEDPDIAQ